MNEYPTASEFLNSIWEQIEDGDHDLTVRISATHSINISNALKDIYNDTFSNIEAAQQGLTALAAILHAASIGKADGIIEELLVEEWRALLDDKQFIEHFKDTGTGHGSPENNR